MPSLLELPQNVWRDNIAYFLNNVEDLVRVDSAVMSKHIRDTFLNNISGCKRFNSFLGYKSGMIKWFVLRNIVVSRVFIGGRFHSEDAGNVQEFMSRAQSIHCYNALSLESVQAISAELMCSSGLLELTLIGCDYMDMSPLSACTSLTFLQMDDCPNVSNESFSKGISGCTQLRTCLINGCTTMRASAVLALLQNCVHLKYLTLRGSFDFKGVFSQITAPLALEYLSCIDSSDSISLKSTVMRDIASSMPCLHTLYLNYDYNLVTNEDIDVLVRGCRRITHLQLSAMHQLTRSALQSIGQQLPLLQSLFIDQCRSILDADIIALVPAATHLRTLRLCRLDITNAAIQAVGTYCRMLEDLDVCYCSLLTDDAFSTLNVACLNTLDLSFTRVTGTFAAHIFSPHSALERFKAQPCYTLNTSFTQGLNRYDKLTNLRIGYMNVNKSDWLQISTLFPKLSILSIKRASTVDDEVAESFTTHCPYLVVAVYKGCSVSTKYQQFK